MPLLRRAAPRPAAAWPLAFGCPPLDDLLGGGLLPGALTEVHGEAGAGKTNLCLQAVRSAALAGKRVLFIDSEGFSPLRLAQLCGPDLPVVQQRLLVEEVASPPAQARAAARAARVLRHAPGVGLVVVDSATMLYRVQLAEGEGVAERRALLRQLHGLHAAARGTGAAVLLTNQVFGRPGRDGVHPLGGHALRHLAACVVRLERDPAVAGARSAVLLKHPARAEGLRAPFALGPRGLEPGALPANLRDASTVAPK